MEFQFNNQLTPQNQIDIDNIGSFALEASNDDGLYYYYLVKTVLGHSIIASCGPIIPDLDILPSGFSISLHKMNYNENRLFKVINSFLNDKEKKITSAYEISIEDAINRFRDLKDYLRNLDTGEF